MEKPRMTDALELAAVCAAAADAGAAILRDLVDRPREIALKGAIDLVTDADRASEARVLALLAERAPGVAVLSEERGAVVGAAGARFIVDPLDGTTNFAHGIPFFCCTVAAEVGGRVVAGCTVDPMRGERFVAWRGGGAWLECGDERRRLAVTRVADLRSAVVCSGFPYDRGDALPAMLAAWGRFTDLSRGTRRLGSAALDLAYVAAGRLDGFWEQGLHAWDVAAGHVLVVEAGGLVTTFAGAPSALDGGSDPGGRTRAASAHVSRLFNEVNLETRARPRSVMCGGVAHA